MPNSGSPTTFVRAWPPSPDGVQPGGDLLGFLRYCPRDPAAAVRVNVPKSAWVMLDPMATAPNAMIGVSFNPHYARSSWHLMHPGDVVYAGGEFYEFWIFNADGLDLVSGGLPAAPVRPVGYCGFLVGRGTPPTRTGVNPQTRICGFTVLSEGSPIIPAGSCTRFRVYLRPLSAAKAIVASAWTGEIRVQPFWNIPGGTITSTRLDLDSLDAPTLATFFKTDHQWIVGGVDEGNNYGGMFEVRTEGAHALRFELGALNTWSGAALGTLEFQCEGIE